jgi:NNP family nitrate/nitrite transporter-like MFS transporter
LLAKGITVIKFDANMWVFLVLVILIGISWGIGKAAVYKHIPEYFPTEVGVVGGMVGMIGGLGGFLWTNYLWLLTDRNRNLVKFLDFHS